VTAIALSTAAMATITRASILGIVPTMPSFFLLLPEPLPVELLVPLAADVNL